MDFLNRLLRRSSKPTPMSDRTRDMTVRTYGALVFDSEDEYGELIADLTEFVRAHPANAAAYNNRGLAYSEIGMGRLAAADYGRAIELDGTNPTIYRNRAELFASHGDHDSAIADLSRAIELDPLDLSAVLRRADAYRATGRDAESLADTKRADEIRTTDARQIEFERVRIEMQRLGKPDPP